MAQTPFGEMQERWAQWKATAPFTERLRFAVELAGGIVTTASRLEVSEGTISNYLHGRTSPQLAFLEALATISGVQLAWLAAGKGNASSEPAEEAPEGAEPMPLPRVTLSLPGNLLLELVKSASVDLPQEVREAIAKALKEGR